MSHRAPLRSSRTRLGAALLAGAAVLAVVPGAPPAGAEITTGTRGRAELTLLAGNGASDADGFVDGTAATGTPLTEPASLSVAPDGSTYLVTGQRHEVVHIVGGKAYRVAGGGSGQPVDGADARSVDLDDPDVAVGPDGGIRIAAGNQVFTLTGDGHLDEVSWTYPAGTAVPSSAADFDAIEVDQLGRVLVIDRTTAAVLRVNGDGTATRVAGGGNAEAKNGGVAANTNLGNVRDVAGSPTGDLYVIGTYAGFAAVWRVDTAGKLKLFAGNPYGSWPTCSPAPQQTLAEPRTVATDTFGRVYIGAQFGLYKIRGDGQQVFIGDPNGGPQPETLGLATGPADELVVSFSDGTVRSSPFVAEREGGCRAYPYLEQYQQIAAQKLVDAQIVRFHAAVPSPQQKYDWADLIYRTTLDPSDLVVELEHRPTFAGPVGGTSRLYLASFGRPADTSGLRYWVAKKFDGMTLARIATTFTQSPEFVRKYGSLSNGAFVDRVYQNVLGRSPDAGGRAHWVAKLAAGASRGSVMVSFSESSEFSRKTAVRTEATLATFGLLGRAPSATEVTAWTTHLANGHNVSELVAWTWYSAEHAERVKKKLG